MCGWRLLYWTMWRDLVPEFHPTQTPALSRGGERGRRGRGGAAHWGGQPDPGDKLQMEEGTGGWEVPRKGSLGLRTLGRNLRKYCLLAVWPVAGSEVRQDRIRV